MHSFVVTMQELIEQLKKELGVKESVRIFKQAVQESKLDIRITESGVITADESVNNEENYLLLFKALRKDISKKIGAEKTHMLFKEASRNILEVY